LNGTSVESAQMELRKWSLSQKSRRIWCTWSFTQVSMFQNLPCNSRNCQSVGIPMEDCSLASVWNLPWRMINLWSMDGLIGGWLPDKSRLDPTVARPLACLVVEKEDQNRLRDLIKMTLKIDLDRSNLWQLFDRVFLDTSCGFLPISSRMKYSSRASDSQWCDPKELLESQGVLSKANCSNLI